MRIAVIADIHANLEALQAVLGRIAELAVDEIVCLGDIVGYHANPNECVDIIRSRKIVSVLGNHDACASGLENPYRFNAHAWAAVIWTREHLTEGNRSFLRNLPREMRVHDFYLMHGSIHDTNRYLLSRADAVDNFQLLAGLPGALKLGFFGHTHVGTAFIDHQGSISNDLSSELSLSPGTRYLINPGSVGQPRDDDPRASFLVYDRDERTMLFFRVEYDIKACQDKIVRAGLPPQLAWRLDQGQ
ncbi:MAG: metallophosphatase family protein [Nitrospirae bacterium]|nr:metallophosphatase family protein [Nitrospirota bacterium]